MFKRPIRKFYKSFISTFALFLVTFPYSSVSALETTLANGDNLSLFGISIHQEQLNDIYVGALFATENTERVNQILDPSASKRMSLKFISSYSNRKMSRLWKQRIAMNNPKSEWRPMTKEIVQFAGIFKRAMQAGDELNIDFEPVSGTSVYLNKTLFLTIPNLDFYKLLLNVWVGSIPPTKNFKIGITGNNKGPINEQLITRYENIQPELGRFDEDKIVKTKLAKAETAKANVKASTTPKKTTNNKKTTTQKKVKSTPQKQKEPVVSQKNKTATDKVVKQLKNDLEAPRTQVEVVKPKLTISTDLGKKAKQPSANKTKNDTTPAVSSEKVAKLDVPPEEFFDADLFSGSYTRELINSIRAVQKYPKKARIAGVEGEVTALVKIDKWGKILENSIKQKSGSRILDRAVLKMVRKAAPFPVIPDELKAKEFEFEVPLSFTLTE